METILKTSQLGIQFGGHKAVDGVTIDIPAKHFKSIIGPNGAGKTTFFNLISGELQATSGEVFFKGENISKRSPVERTRLGLGRSFQITNVFPNLTVLENVRLAVQSREKVRFHVLRHFTSYKRITEDASAILER